MKTRRALLAAFIFALAVSPVFSWTPPQQPVRAPETRSESKPDTKPAVSAPRPIELADILKWKRIQTPTPSSDGRYFAHKLVPVEGDSEVVVRRIEDGKEWRFPVGESAGFGGGGGPFGAIRGGSRELAFSEDGKWFAYTVSPGFREARRLRRERRPLQNKVVLVNLATEQKTEFEKIRRFAFSGDASTWIALHRYGADAPGGGGPAGPPAGAPSGGPGGAAAADRPTGSDLILHELASGNTLNFGNVADFSFDEKGDWLVWTIDAQDKIGNGIQLRNMTTGAVLPLESDKAVYRGLNWTEKYDGLAALKGVDHKDWEDKLYSVVAFTDLAAAAPRKTLYDPQKDSSFPAGMTVSPNRNPTWNEDKSAILFGIHEVKKKKPERAAGPPREGDAPPAGPGPAGMRRPEETPETPALVLWHWKDGRLQPQQQVEENRDKNSSYLSVYRVAENKFIRLADETLRQVTAARGQWAIGSDNREYELMGNLDGRRYQDLYVVDMKTGERKLAVKKNRWSFGASPDGSQFLYYDDGHFFTYDPATGQSTNITAKVPAVFHNEEDDHNVVKPPRFPMGWTKDGKSVLISDGWDIWNVPARGGAAVNLTGNGKKEGIRYRNRYQLDPNERGIDLSAPLYIGVYGEWTKKAGIGRIENGKPGARMLVWDDAAFGGLMKAKKAERYFYTRETYRDYPDYQVADAMLAGAKTLTAANTQQKDYLWSSGSKLIDYTSAKGDKLQGSLFLPADYEPGRSYPTVVYIYERLSQGHNSYTSPTANGFNKSVYTSQGYAVLMPDITYKVNDPGMSAVWCVLPALEAAIKTGVVDRSRVAIHGHSWGGYQTAFLVTQTDAFRAAIAGAPLTDMISMYNLIYWNTGSGNMSIFESSQGRFTGSPVDVPDAYIRNSPIYHAKNVKTPLMILHNDKDGAVDFTQGIEYFSTLRRMQKPVVMLQYKGENHGLTVPANRKDYTVRMKEFLDHHLMGKPAPKWLDAGVPHLKLKDHLEERVKEGQPDPITPLSNQ
ncbi:MAG: S9 family peptidase [Acidobacteria bacterium]|nr:S9 family peptidase [Acidobacteriota bacterium]